MERTKKRLRSEPTGQHLPNQEPREGEDWPQVPAAKKFVSLGLNAATSATSGNEEEEFIHLSSGDEVVAAAKFMLDDDCMLHVLECLVMRPASDGEEENKKTSLFEMARMLLCVRLVSRQWASLVMGAQSLWRSLFLQLFGPSVGMGHSTAATGPRVRVTCAEADPDSEEEEENDEEEPADADSWFTKFLDACRQMPRWAKVPQPKSDEGWYKEEENNDDENPYYLNTEKVDFLAISYPFRIEAEMNYRAHQLALIMALLDREGYEVRVSDLVRIGFTDKHCLIPMARFCYAYMYRKEKSLVQDLGLDRSQLSPLPTGKLRRVALCPYYVDASGHDFQPFVHFLSSIVGEGKRTKDLPKEFVEDNHELLGSREDIGSIYYFHTDEEGGWAPGFFNASFSWFQSVGMTTICVPSKRRIFVVLAREKVVVL